jgi:hypothetical protein
MTYGAALASMHATFRAYAAEKEAAGPSSLRASLACAAARAAAIEASRAAWRERRPRSWGICFLTRAYLALSNQINRRVP